MKKNFILWSTTVFSHYLKEEEGNEDKEAIKNER